jgi:predicted RNA-binding Zn-ribbon protein involved in translation (DUF1610 family)
MFLKINESERKFLMMGFLIGLFIGALFGILTAAVIFIGSGEKMKWIEQEVQTYYPVYKCSNCGDEIMVAEACELPYYCKNCGEDEEE